MTTLDDYKHLVQPPDFDQIAPKLRTKPNFVLWNPRLRPDGTIEKPLYRARPALYHGKQFKASSTNPTSWSTFNEAQKAYERGGYTGIGRTFTEDEHIIFLDFDHCMTDRSTREPNPVVREILDELQTYGEKSPTDGAHAYLICPNLPPGLKSVYHYKGQKIEVYWTGRYSTLTGHRIAGTPADIEERQARFTALIKRFEQWEEENTSCVCVCGDSQVPPAQTSTQEKRNEKVLRFVGRGAQTSTGGTKSAETNVSANPAQRSTPPIAESDLPREDQAVLAKARAARNGQTFIALWEGRDPKNRKKPSGQPDESAADFDLALLLLYWTNDNPDQAERMFRASKRYRDDKTDRVANRRGQSYITHTIDNALQKRGKARRAPSSNPQALNLLKQSQNLPPDPEPPPPPPGQRKPARQDRRITHMHHWTRAHETEDERQQKLQAEARAAAERVEQHIRGGERGLLVANVAPGVGKSSTVAPLGLPGGLDLAWIAERRDMLTQVEALKSYRHIEPCTRHNCPDGFHLHQVLGERGYNTQVVHKRHVCSYGHQHQQSGSAVYQLAHVRTRYPANHEGIIIDELDITKWLPERELSIGRLSAAARIYATGSTADLLLRTVAAVITDASQARQQLHGLELFTALDRRSGGQLANWLGELEQDKQYTDTHPWHELSEDDPAAQELEASTLAPVVLPHIVVVLLQELRRWQNGQPWNSCMRIGAGIHGWALHITERLRFTPGEDKRLPARAILDATADTEILSRLTGEQIDLVQGKIDPPPGTRHIAIRTGKRYGKLSLTTRRKDGSPNRDLQRAIAEARYILREEDSEGQARDEQRIGLISFMGCIDQLGEALGIPEHRRLHFWAARGSNALEDCTILLVIGTPTIHPATVARLARALYQNDAEPISEESEIDSQGIRRYTDARMQRVDSYLTRAELTQCAHRSRALRAARTVVTFCLSEIDYLPPTETVTDLPQLTSDGRERWAVNREAEREKLEKAREVLEQDGKSIHMLTVRELKAAANVSTDAAAEYLRQARHVAQQESCPAGALPNDESQDTHTHNLCSHQSVPDVPNRTFIENGGTNVAENPPPAPDVGEGDGRLRAGTETTPPSYGTPCARCGHVDNWQPSPNGDRWLCACYYWWYEHPEWRGQQREVMYL